MSEHRGSVLFEGASDPGFADEIRALPSGDGIDRCIQCGTCTGACPVAWAMEEAPRKIIALARAGLKDRVLDSDTIWTCASCYSCSARCPQEIGITELMYGLRRVAVREGRQTKAAARILSDSFVATINRRGRNHELSLMLRFMLAHQPLGALKESAVGWHLKRRGRLPFRGKRIKDTEGLGKILARAREMRGEA